MLPKSKAEDYRLVLMRKTEGTKQVKDMMTEVEIMEALSSVGMFDAETREE